MLAPRYPQIHAGTRSQNPLALVGAVRLALRQARVERSEIQRFSAQALASENTQRLRHVCSTWVSLDVPPDGDRRPRRSANGGRG